MTARPFGAAEAREVAQLMRAAARTEIMTRFRRLGAGDMRAKSSPWDLVTAADEAAEACLAQGLSRLFPGALVVGEEGAARDPSLLAALPDAEFAFVVDPIDGTGNFAAGLPLFGVMVGAVARGEVIGAAILDPMTDSTALAVRGEGAWEVQADGSERDLRVAPPAPLEQLRGAASWRFLPAAMRRDLLPRLQCVGQVWDFRCAAHEYRMLAAGHSHFVLFHRLMPWDHLPGWLLHREAGGFAAQFDRAPYRPGVVAGGLICAPDEASWTALHDAFLGSDPAI